MNEPFIIAINAVSGGGKTALTDLLSESLPKAVSFHFDEFDESNVYPDNYYEWTIRGADLQEFDCPGMAAAVEEAVKEGTADFIILDYPFSRDHPRFRERIDLSVFIDTPLDVAMARRISRNLSKKGGKSAEKRLAELKKELESYADKARYAYLDTCRHKDTSDLILDGWADLENLRDQILDYINIKQSEALDSD